jgi:hypothetical protein
MDVEKASSVQIASESPRATVSDGEKVQTNNEHGITTVGPIAAPSIPTWKQASLYSR